MGDSCIFYILIGQHHISNTPDGQLHISDTPNGQLHISDTPNGLLHISDTRNGQLHTLDIPNGQLHILERPIYVKMVLYIAPRIFSIVAHLLVQSNALHCTENSLNCSTLIGAIKCE